MDHAVDRGAAPQVVHRHIALLPCLPQGFKRYACAGAGAVDLGERVRAGGKEGIGSPDRRQIQSGWPGSSVS